MKDTYFETEEMRTQTSEEGTLVCHKVTITNTLKVRGDKLKELCKELILFT